MLTSNEILRKFKFSPETLERVARKTTEQGRIRELSTRQAFAEAYRSDEFIYQEIFDYRRKASNNTCVCGSKISTSYFAIRNRKFKCRKCKRIECPTKGTPLEKRKKILIAINLIFNTITNKKGYTTSSEKRFIGGKRDTMYSYRYIACELMHLALENMQFNSIDPIQVDTMYPTVPSLLPKGVRLKRGLGSERLRDGQVVAQEDGLVRAIITPDTNAEIITPLLLKYVSTGSTVYTDGATVYNGLNKFYNHHSCDHKNKVWSLKIDKDGKIENVNTNTAESYIGISKTQIKNYMNGVTERHLQGYLDDSAFAFSHRHSNVYEAIDNIFKALPPFFQ